jgi:SSS family solute:Na+ symporter
VLNILLGYNVSWQIVQRYMSVPRERDARKMAMLCAVLSVVGPLLWILPVMASRLIFPDIDSLWPALADPAEASFVSLALLLLPHGMIGFVVSAIMSATLGQANDAFNWLAATFTRDVYVPLHERLKKPEPTERRQLAFARGVMVLVGTLGIAVALYIPRFGGAFSFALEYYSLLVAFMMPVALGILYTKTPWWSGIASCSAALGVTGILMAVGIGSDHAMIRNVLSESITASLVFFGSAFWYDRTAERSKEIERFALDLRTSVRDEAYQIDVQTLRVYRMLAQVCLLLGLVLAGCMALPGESSAVINGIAAAMLLAIAAVLYRISRR